MRRGLAALHYTAYVGSMALIWLLMVSAPAPEAVENVLKALLAAALATFGVLGLKEAGGL